MPERDDRGRGVFPDRSGWRVGFALAWCGLLALTAAASLLLGGFSTARGVFLAGVAAGEFVLAVVSSVLLERTVFRHVERLRSAVVQGTDGPLPSVKGPLAPLAVAISARQERSVATLREAVRDREERLTQVERLRRAGERAVRGRAPPARIAPASAAVPRVSCLIGERLWQQRWGGNPDFN